ncbi:MAG: hypothetical protein WDN48_01375 [Pseudolabrys sp.]
MAKKSRKKSAAKAKKTSKKSAKKTSKKKVVAKRKKARKAKSRSFGARVSGAYRAVVDTIEGTDKLRNKLEQPGTSESE